MAENCRAVQQKGKIMKNVLFEKHNHIGIITFNRPESLNALSSGFVQEIHDTVKAAEADDEVYVLVLTGTGKSFIAGADIEEMYPMGPEEIFEFSSYATELNMRLEKMPKPVIAAINGYALGGGLEVALACDIRYASETAKMGLPEVKLGVICGSGGTQRLCRIIGDSIAKEMIFTGRAIDAQEAMRIGLVNKVLPQEELMPAVLELAEEICRYGQLAIRASKKCINFAQDHDIEEGSLYERQRFSELFVTEDQKIGMGGFLRKEKDIKFKNR